MIVDRIVIFLLCNFSLTEHFIQTVDLPFSVVLRIIYRVIGIRHLCDRSNNRTLGNIKLINRLTEICFSCGFDTVTALTEVYGVEIGFKDLILIKILFKIKRRQNLIILTDISDLVVARNILNELLCNR